MATYIEQKQKDIKNTRKTYELEDYLIKGQIAHAKRLIDQAIQMNRSSVACCYDYDTYDSFMMVKSSLDGYFGPFSTYAQAYKTEKNMGCGELSWHGAIVDFFKGILGYNPPSGNKEIDYTYIENGLRREFYRLGCKTVSLYIGPKPVTYRVLDKKGLFGNKYSQKQTFVNKWMFEISW